jgi:hypothetical protein
MNETMGKVIRHNHLTLFKTLWQFGVFDMATQTKNAEDKGNVTVDRFIEVNVQAHKEGKGIPWIAETLGMKETIVQARRTELRGKGIPLPQLKKGKAGTGTGGLGGISLEEAQKFLAKAMGKDIKEVAKEGKELIAAAEQRKGTAA